MDNLINQLTTSVTNSLDSLGHAHQQKAIKLPTTHFFEYYNQLSEQF